MNFSVIYARDRGGAFGLKGGLPWSSSDDLAWFKSHTENQIVVMGRHTWDSLPQNQKPLPNRCNIVVSTRALNKPVHEWTVTKQNYDQIRLGQKTILAGLCLTERSLVKSGDTLKILCDENKESLECVITECNRYTSFNDLLSALPIQQLLPGITSVEEGLTTYRKSCTFQSERMYGVMSVHLDITCAERLSPLVMRVSTLDQALKLSSVLKTKINQDKIMDSKDVKLDVFSPRKHLSTPSSKELTVFVIGGSKLLNAAFAHPKMEYIYESLYDGVALSDVQFNAPIPPRFLSVFSETRPQSATIRGSDVLKDVSRQVFVRRYDNAESRYLELIKKVLVDGQEEIDRTGVGTLSTFGEMFRLNLADGFPMLTSKRVFWKGVVAELLWFLRGETNVFELHKEGVHFWDGNLASSHTKSLNLPPGELGPVYGKQWRAFGTADPHGLKIDQIKRAIDDIRSSPNSRRIIVSAWNPLVLDKVALPSCHCFFQFEVKQGKLSCFLLLRSNDLFLGAPLNLASYALLTHIVAGMTGLKVGSLVYTIVNCHIYKNHIDQVKEQLARPTRPLPTIQIDQKILDLIYPVPVVYPTNTVLNGPTILNGQKSSLVGPDFSLLKREHIQLIGYDPLPAILASMAV